MPRSRCRGIAILTLFFAIFATFGFSFNTGYEGNAAQASTTSIPVVAVSSYFFTASLWTQIASAPSVAMAIVNVNSGPGTQKFAYAQTAVNIATSGNVPLAGYVSTRYGHRNVAEVLADVASYQNWYGIKNIFLDETPYLCDEIAYYHQIADVIHAAGGKAILNPGMNPGECFVAVADVLVNFEGTSQTYENWRPAAWTSSYPAAKFWHIIYGSSPSRVINDRALAASRNAGWLYVTDDALPNPWDSLPSGSLWNTLFGISDPPPRSTAPSAPAPIGSGDGARLPAPQTPPNASDPAIGRSVVPVSLSPQPASSITLTPEGFVGVVPSDIPIQRSPAPQSALAARTGLGLDAQIGEYLASGGVIVNY